MTTRDYCGRKGGGNESREKKNEMEASQQTFASMLFILHYYQREISKHENQYKQRVTKWIQWPDNVFFHTEVSVLFGLRLPTLSACGV